MNLALEKFITLYTQMTTQPKSPTQPKTKPNQGQL